MADGGLSGTRTAAHSGATGQVQAWKDEAAARHRETAELRLEALAADGRSTGRRSVAVLRGSTTPRRVAGPKLECFIRACGTSVQTRLYGKSCCKAVLRRWMRLSTQGPRSCSPNWRPEQGNPNCEEACCPRAAMSKSHTAPAHVAKHRQTARARSGEGAWCVKYMMQKTRKACHGASWRACATRSIVLAGGQRCVNEELSQLVPTLPGSLGFQGFRSTNQTLC